MKLLNKFLSFISLFAILFLQIATPLQVLAQEATPSATVEPSPTPSPSETPAPSAEPSPTPTPTPSLDESLATPPATQSAVIDTSTIENQSSASLAPPLWQINSDGSANTTDPVTLNTIYKAPQNDKVTVTFTKLPENPGKLTIKQIILSQEDKEDLGAVSEIAYDITSTMENGTFEYTLILPTPTVDNVEVKSSENGQTFVTLGGVTAQTDTLNITVLTHFTIFVVAGTVSGNTATVFDESNASIVINEFVVDPTDNEWVELYNKTNADISLTNWRLEDGNSLTTDDITLSGTILAGGFLVFENADWLNNPVGNGTGDTITLKNGAEVVDRVTYIKKTGSTVVINADDLGVCCFGPGDEESIGRTTDGAIAGDVWTIDTSPTKGYSNSGSIMFITVGEIYAYTSIQNAINNIVAGGTVNILAGTGSYDEAVSVGKNITIKGAGNTTVWEETGGDVALTITTGNVTVEKINFSSAGTAVQVNGGSVTIKNSQIFDNTAGVNVGVGVSLVTASHNFWGTSNGPTHSTNSAGSGDSISDGVAYRPFYTDSARTTLSTITVAPADLSSLFTTGGFSVPSGATNTSTPQVNVNEALTINVSVTGGTHAINLPSGTVITKTDGTNLDATALTSSNVSTSTLSGLGSGVVADGAIQWGIPNIGLTFSTPITLSIFVGTALNGQTLNVVRSVDGVTWTSDGIVAPTTCLVTSGLCTFQATKASTYATTHTVAAATTTATQATTTPSGPFPAPSCNDQKPGSAPTLISALTGANSITLNWNRALDPVTYYLITYGLGSGLQQYGNPNVGGRDTTSHTVSGLSGGTAYYFKVRAGNGCAPGDFSNELSAAPSGEEVAGPATGFAPGVLGTTSEQGEVKGEATPSTAEASITVSPQGEASQSAFPVKTVVVIVIVLLLGFGVFRLFFK